MEWDKIIPNDATNKGLFSKLYKKKKKTHTTQKQQKTNNPTEK